MQLRRERWIDPYRPEKGTRSDYDISTDYYLKRRPEFKELMDELDATFAAGVTEPEVKKYSDRYEKIYNQQRELEMRLTEMQKADPEAWNIVMNLIFDRDNKLGIDQEGMVAFADAKLEKAIDKHLKEKKEREVSREQSSRFYELRNPALGAMEGMEAEGVLTVAKKEASKRGFRSRNKMWQHDLEAVRKFRDGVGIKRFQELAKYEGSLRDIFGK